MLSTQWRAVPTYCEEPSVKMKFAVQPAGATMQPPAETPGLCTPGHSVLSAASGMLTPFAPFLASFFSMLGFMNFAGARVGPLAAATPAVAIDERAREREHDAWSEAHRVPPSGMR